MRALCAGFLCLLVSLVATAQPPGDAPKTPFRGRGAGPGRGDTAPRREPLPDRSAPGRMVALEVLIAETDGLLEQPTAAKLLELEKAQKLAGAARIRLAALEELPSFAKFSELVPRIVGTTNAGARVTPNYQDIAIGTTVQVTLRFDEEGRALVQLFVERSRMAKSKSQEGMVPEPQGIQTLSAQSTVRAKIGEPLLISAGPATSAGGTQGWVVLLVSEP